MLFASFARKRFIIQYIDIFYPSIEGGNSIFEKEEYHLRLDYERLPAELKHITKRRKKN